MLISYQAMLGAAVDAADGDLGSLDDALFDRQTWHIRYLSADIGGWLSQRHAVFAPEVVERADWAEGRLSLRLTREQVRQSPPIDRHELVSRQKEMELARHFGWRPYWSPGTGGVPDGYGLPTATIPDLDADEHADLWQAGDVVGYSVRCSGDEVGYVEDLILDDHSWLVRYVVVDLGNWITGRRVLVAPPWVESIGWDSRCVDLSLPKQDLEKSPEFDPQAPVNRDYEDRLYDFYGRPKYWA